jgi:uncharacterized protein GlcG (DUF336 family)
MTSHIDEANEQRAQLKATAAAVLALRSGMTNSEAIANVMLAYRHLEDASMRLGKVIQALDGGVSVYDKRTTVGA